MTIRYRQINKKLHGETRAKSWARVTAAFSVILISFLTAQSASADAVRNHEYWLDDYGFRQAWTYSKGAGVRVAIIDTGVAGNVADLKGAVVDGTDVSGLGSSDGQTPVGEESSHGTMVASLLAGRGTGSEDGVIGVAPEAQILTISVAFGNKANAAKSDDDQIAEAIVWAVDHGAQVINMSLTRNTRDWPTSWDKAFLYAYQKNVVVVAAAGNRGTGTTEVGAPATIPGVLVVAGVGIDKKASFDASSQGITIGVAAPSENLVGVAPDGKYNGWSGTSGATPLVSGLVALVRAKYPDLDAANVIERVIRTANPNGERVPSPIYGNGLVDPVAALTEDVAAVPADTLVADLQDWIKVHRRASSVHPTETTAPIPVTTIPDPLPLAADPSKTLLPSQWSLTYMTVPLTFLVVFGTLATLLCVAAFRQIRKSARVRGQKPNH